MLLCLWCPGTRLPGSDPTLLRGWDHLADSTRGTISNCAWLGEEVDIPVLDDVVFIAPKRSMVEIIQAVG